MLLVYQLWASLSASIALASAAASSIEGTNDLMLALAPASNVSYPTSASEQVNITFEPFNVDGSNDPKIACNGAQFGRGLTYGACLDAISTFQTPITGNVSIGPRDHRQRYDYHLPWRWISGDGRCAFDVVKMNTYAFALATAEELRTAATSLADACVRDRGGKGGIVTNVGKSTYKNKDSSNSQCCFRSRWQSGDPNANLRPQQNHMQRHDSRPSLPRRM